MSPTTLDIVPLSVSYLTRLKSVIRSAMVLGTYDNPLYWNFTLGKRNAQADVEGPFYMLDAPDVQFEKGKATLAPIPLLKSSRPFLMTVRILSPEGSPLPGAVLDWWQADTSGSYYFATYTLRGRITTDEQGCAEVLTIAPGAYGALGAMRSGHFHLWVHAPPSQAGKVTYDDLMTQMYVCDANDTRILDKDAVNHIRGKRNGNMVQAWSVPDKDIDEGRPYMDFPELSSNDEITRKRIEWWNSKLAETSEPGLKIGAGATKELRLNSRTGWF